MMRRLFVKIAGLFKSNGNGNGCEPADEEPVNREEVTRKNVDRQTHRIQAKAVLARLRLEDVERKLTPPECSETSGG